MFLALLTLFCLTVAWCIRKNFTYWKKFKHVVASVPGRIFSLDSIAFLKGKTNFGYHLRTIYEDPKFINEPVVGIYGFYKPSLLIKEPELLKAIMIKDFYSFRDRWSQGDSHSDPVGGNLILFMRYHQWKNVRPKFTPFFSSGKLKSIYPQLKKISEKMENNLKKMNEVNQLELKDFCSRYVTDITVITLFGFTSNAVENIDDGVYKEVSKIGMWNWNRIFNILIIFFVPKMAKFFKSKFFFQETNDFLSYTFDQMMAERERSGEKGNDIFDIFLKLQQEAIANGEDVKKSREVLLGQLGMFMAADFETTSAALSNILLELAKNPDIQEKLRSEICQAYVEGKGDISYEALMNMKYLEMVIYEGMRLYPLLPVLERVYSDPSGEKKPYSLQPYSEFCIPEGMPVYISAYALNFDPKYWHNPSKFDPEHFTDENIKKRHPLITLPFGNGPHRCVGGRMGLLQIKTGIVYMLRNHYVRVCAATNLQPELEAMSFILQLKGDVNLEIVRDNMGDNLIF